MGAFSRTLLTGSLAADLVACSTVKDGVAAGYDLDSSKQKHIERSLEVSGRSVELRAYEGIVYVRSPVDTKYEIINVYIPKAYYGDGSISSFTVETTPAFFPNQIGGYIPVEPDKPRSDRGGETSQTPNAASTTLSRGYVVASPGARERTTANGEAPTAVVNLKAAVRYLGFDDKAMPGDAGRIISNGTSAGGALSALLGVTGNSRDHGTRLKALGAAGGGDDIFAVSAYCLITDSNHVDMAYEQQFDGVNDYQKMNISMLDYNVKHELVPSTLTKEEISLSDQLKPLCPAYIDGLKLKNASGRTLTLDKNGNGSFRNYAADYLTESTQSQLDAGRKLGNRNWLTVKNGKITVVDFGKYAKAAGRQKIPPALDGVGLSTEENQLFGNAQTDKRHFTKFSMRRNTAKNAAMADTETIKIMNPPNYIGTSGVKIPQNWRIRVGTAGRDTSLTVSAILATKLQDSGYAVGYFLPWDVPHNGDRDSEGLFIWMKQVSTQE